MKVVFKFEFLTYLYHNNSFFRFMYDYDTLMLPVLLLLTLVLFFQSLYVPMLISSILLVLFNTFFIFDLPFLPVQILSGYVGDYTWLRFICLLGGIWGLIRSFKEVKTMVLDNERVLAGDNFMVEGGAGREQWVLDTTEQFIKDAHMPGVYTEQKDVTPGLFGEKRKFLVVRHGRYKEWHVFIGARSFGEHLDAGWFLTVEPSLFKRTVSRHATGNPTAFSQKIDFFSQQDVRAFKTVAERAVERTLQMLYEELKLDPSGLNVGNKGFLSVW